LYWWARNQLSREGGKWIKSLPHLGHLSVSPQENNLEKSGKSPRILQKERQVSKRVKQRATNLFTCNVSKGGHPNETSHSLSLNPPAAPLKENDPRVSLLQTS